MKKFRGDQRRKNQFHSLIDFVLNRGDSSRISRMFSKGKLDKNVTVQASHGWPNISSASSP
jgi:hypothetical protein